MSESKPRRWLQIHLSTAIAMMLVASVLVWANVYEQRSIRYNIMKAISEHEQKKKSVNSKVLKESVDSFPAFLGWPFVGLEIRGSKGSQNWRYGSVLANLIVAIVLIATTAIACEWFIRRRHKMKKIIAAAGLFLVASVILSLSIWARAGKIKQVKANLQMLHYPITNL